jgi:AcrR family transcriptional regulator
MRRGRTKGNYEAKRADIAKAAFDVILRQGLAATTLSDIAREMGYTTGVLRHYFADKDELLLYAKNALFDQQFERASRAAATRVGLEKLRAMAREVLPLDAGAVDRYRLLATFNGHAIGNERLMLIQHRRNERHWQFFAEQITALQAEGILPSALDARLQGCAILALADGLAEETMMCPNVLSAKQLLSVMDHYIDSLSAVGPKKVGRPQRKRPRARSLVRARVSRTSRQQ